MHCWARMDDNRKLNIKEFNLVLFSSSNSKGFQNGALSVTLGNMKFQMCTNSLNE